MHPLLNPKLQALVTALKLQLAEDNIELRELVVKSPRNLRGAAVQGVRLQNIQPETIEVNTKTSELELKVLKELVEHYHDECANCLYIRYIASQTGLEQNKARRAVRALARKGLAVLERGLFNEDGEVAGSGYRATRAGAMLLVGCVNKDTCDSLTEMVTGECSECWEKRREFEFTDDWQTFKKGERIKRDAVTDDEFKALYWGTSDAEYKDKKIKDATPTPEWCCQECGNQDCVC